MAKITRIMVLVSLLLCQPACHQQNQTPPVPAETKLQNITVLRDLEYIQGGHERHRLDLYLPDKSSRPNPVIVWIHGGGWQGGDKSNCPLAVRQFAGKGYAVAAINYRFSRHAIFPAQIHDCKAAIRWLRAYAGDYGFDPYHIGVWGGSAGAQLASLLGLTAGVKEFEGPGGNETQSSSVQAVVAVAGPSDFLTVGSKPTRTSLLGGDPLTHRDQAIKASPITYVSGDASPFILIHGDQDKTVSISQSVTLAQALKKAGVEATLLTVKGAGHSGPGFYSPENMKIITDFFARHLAPPSSPPPAH